MSDVSELPPIESLIKSRPPGMKSMLEAIPTPSPLGSPAPEPKKKEEIEIPRGEEIEHEEDDFSLSDKPPAAKKPETTPEPPKKSKEVNMRELARLREEAEARAVALEKKVSETENQFKTRIAELETMVEKTNFEASTKFKTGYLAPIDEAAKAVTDFVAEMGEEPSVAEKILSLKGKERMEYIDSAIGSGSAAAELLRLATLHSEKLKSRDTAIVNYKQTQEQFKAEEKGETEKEAKLLEKNFIKVLDKLAPKVLSLREIDGDDEHNAGVKDRIKTAREIMMGTAKEDDILLAPFLAVTAKHYMAQNKALREELAKYKRRVTEEAETNPLIRGTIPGSPKPKGAPQGMNSRVSGL